MRKDSLPALFIGHGSPMNVISENRYTRDLEKLAALLPKPRAILVISAHWLTRGTYVTSSEMPEQIYDFYGFPQELYEIKYRAAGSRSTAELIGQTVGNKIIKVDEKRGIDHAAWAVLKFLYPRQNIPVLELSLDLNQDPFFHFELGKKLAPLRDKEILFIGSGNMVHNLQLIEYREDAKPFDWAIKMDQIFKEYIEKKNFSKLINYRNLEGMVNLAIPTNDHYLPVLYILAMMEANQKVEFIHESIQNASISMRSFKIT